jgi:predicted dehydrogenase
LEHVLKAELPFKVLIIGCGNIAGGYDLLQPLDTLPLGHAKAFLQNGNFVLAACVEPDIEKRNAFQKHWKVTEGFGSLQDAGIGLGKFDVISICSPTHSHAEDIKNALLLKPKIIFCEKPVTSSLEDTQIVVTACEKQKVLLAVNYSRRWSTEVIKLKSELNLGHWGVVRSVTAVYNKGILNNGSHMLDLLHFWFGSLHVTSVGQAVNDFFADDPSVAATLNSELGLPIYLNVAHAQDYAFFEVQIVTEKGVINMEDGGASWRFRHAQASDKLIGFSFLNSGVWHKPNGSNSLAGAVANIFDALRSGASLSSTGENALLAQSLCEQIKNLALVKAND